MYVLCTYVCIHVVCNFDVCNTSIMYLAICTMYVVSMYDNLMQKVIQIDGVQELMIVSSLRFDLSFLLETFMANCSSCLHLFGMPLSLPGCFYA